MTDNDYAARIYCEVFKVEETNGDVHVRGVMDAIKTLDDREQRILESYYRYDMMHKQIGEKFGISAARAKQIILKALWKLRHPSRSKNFSVSEMKKKYDELVESKNDTINALYNQIESLLKGEPASEMILAELDNRKTNVYELGIMPRTYSLLLGAGLHKVESILAIDNPDDLMKIHGFGKALMFEVITKMREHGYVEWADRIEEMKSLEPQRHKV